MVIQIINDVPLEELVQVCLCIFYLKNGWGSRIRTYECRLQKPVPYRNAQKKSWFTWVYFFRILKKCVCNVVVWLLKNSIDLCDYLVVLLNYYWLFKYCSLREFIWQRKLFVRSVNHNLRCDEVEGRINKIKRHSSPGIFIRYLV